VTALRAEKITAGYSRVPIIRDISVTVGDGALAAIVGPNGAGKSTFAKALCGVIKPSAGRIFVGDDEITHLPGHLIVRRGLAYVPQNQNVFGSLTVTENLEMGAFTRSSGVRQRIDEVLDIFPDLRKATGKRAGVLSGGQQNMLAIARALMLDPRVVVLDEPTAGLSPAYTFVVWEQITRITQTGTAALVVEQNVDRALGNASFVYVLVAGANHVAGPAQEVAALDLAAIFLGHEVTAPRQPAAPPREAREPGTHGTGTRRSRA
jgi:ABC-type branched-subunit amino acid transport system ATPase component